MRPIISLIAAAAVLAAVPAHSAARMTPEEKLAKALEGRVAGEPVDCLNLRDIRSSRIIEGTGILYETSGGTLYLNRVEGGAQGLDDDDIQVTDTHSSRLCSVDVVRMYDSGARMPTGVVFLGEFVPYKKPRAGRSD